MNTNTMTQVTVCDLVLLCVSHKSCVTHCQTWNSQEMWVMARKVNYSCQRMNPSKLKFKCLVYFINHVIKMHSHPLFLETIPFVEDPQISLLHHQFGILALAPCPAGSNWLLGTWHLERKSVHQALRCWVCDGWINDFKSY